LTGKGRGVHCLLFALIIVHKNIVSFFEFNAFAALELLLGVVFDSLLTFSVIFFFQAALLVLFD
jgi:hypothetical protein